MKLHNTGSRNPRKSLLVWSDSVLATTGFGRVSYYILHALHATGKYDIDQLAINHFGDFYDKKQYPYCIMPARVDNPNDPYGNRMLLKSLMNKDYDYLFIINDSFVVHGVADKVLQIRQDKMAAGKKGFKIVYYYPVDCRLLPNATGMVEAADRSVAYTQFAKRETKRTLGKGSSCPTDVIYHGADCRTFRPVSRHEREMARARFFNVADDDTFIVVNVNRNSLRKDVAKTILAFSEFKKMVPNSILYLHMLAKDGGASGHVVDLTVPLREVGLKPGEDVFIPANYSPATGVPPDVLNLLYNTGDLFLTTHCGEGWGLSGAEAMACRLPVVIPNNTSTPEIFGKDGDRGYIYDCKEQIFIDNSGFRPVGHLQDILDKLMEAYEDWQDGKAGKSTRQKEILDRASEFTRRFSWDNVCADWVTLFDELEGQKFPWMTQEGRDGEVL